MTILRYTPMTPPSTIEALVTRLDGGAPTAPPVMSATTSTDNTGIARAAATSGNYARGLLPTTTYYYVWTAFNSNLVESLVSNEVSVTTGSGVTPAITTQLTGAVSGAVKYRVYRGTASGQQLDYYETTSTSYKDTGTLSLAYHACMAGYMPPSVTTPATVTTASGAIPLAPGALTTAMLVAKTIAVWVDTGSGFVEMPVYCRGLGRYEDGSYRSVYFKVNVGTALPAYLRAEYTGESGRTFGTLRSPPTYPTYGFRTQIRFGVARTTTDLTTPDWDATHGFTDPTTHLPPTLWLEDVRVRGMTPGVLAATDPNYLTKCGAFGYFATRAESEASGTVGSAFAAIQTQYRFNFDEIVRDARYNGSNQLTVSPFGFAAAFNSCNRTSRCQYFEVTGDMVSKLFAGAVQPAGGAYALSSNRRGETDQTDPVWIAETPPQYGPLRQCCGSMIQSGPYEQQNYDPASYFYDAYLMTGDLAYYQRAANHAWEYAWWARWYDGNGGATVVPFTSGPDYSHQPKGIGKHFLLTAEPLSAQFQQAYAYAGFSANATWADEGTVYSEARPLARRLQTGMWADVATRLTGDSGISSGVALNEAAHDYHTDVLTKLGKTFDTGTCWLPVDVTASGVANGWAQTWGNGAHYVNTYMETMVCDVGIDALERYTLLDSTLADKITARIKANGDFLMDLMEFDTIDNPLTPSTATGANYRHGNFRNFFDSGDSTTNNYRALDWRRYQDGGMELNNFYSPLFFWLGWQYADGSYTQFGEYVFDLGTGNGEFDSITGPGIASQQSKSQGESYTFGWRSSLYRAIGPAAGGLSRDTLAEVRAGVLGVNSYPSTGTVAPSNTVTVIGKRRTDRRRIIRGGSALTAAITSGGSNATITGQTWHSDFGYLVVTVQGVASAPATLTITDPDSAMAGTALLNGAVQTADHLAMSVQPAGAVSGIALTTQPVVLVRDASNATVTGDTSTVTASWVSLTGDASPSGTLTKAAVAGVATFTNLALTWTVNSTGYWHFTDGALTSVNSSTLTLTVAAPPVVIPPPTLVLPTVVDQWRPTQRNREGLEVVPSASPLIGTGGTSITGSATTSVFIPVGRVKVSVLSLSLDAIQAANGSSTITAQVFSVKGGVSTPLTAAQSIKTDGVTQLGNFAMPVLASLFDGPANGSRRIDGTQGHTLRVDVVANGTVTQQPILRVVAELAING